jgi:hypothetical protein
VASLANFCSKTSATGWGNLAIFNNIKSGTTFFGKFGNSDPHFIKDFVKVGGTTLVDAKLTSSATRNSIANFHNLSECIYYSGSTIKVYYSSVGYFEQYQNYIPQVEVLFENQKTLLAAQLTATVQFTYNIEFVDVDHILGEVREVNRQPIIPQIPPVS